MSGGGASHLLLASVVATLAVPMFVLVHELGHAMAGLTRTEGLVVVRVGKAPGRWRLRVGRLQLELHPLPARNAPAGLAQIHARFGAGTMVAISIAGPLAEAIAAAVLVAFGLKLQVGLLTVVGAFGAADALANLVPFARHGRRSDGHHLLDALRSRDPRHLPEHGPGVDAFVQAIADTYSRWLVLYTDVRSPVRTTRRSELLSGAPAALGHRSIDTNPQALALWQLAFAGWCWRNAERGGDMSSLRETALDALHQQRVAGAIEPALTILAARELATGDTDLSRACPGSSDHERAAFLAAGFRKLPAQFHSAVLPDAQQKFAFNYGVALHDVERADAFS
jgi:hypothetical protein